MTKIQRQISKSTMAMGRLSEMPALANSVWTKIGAVSGELANKMIAGRAQTNEQAAQTSIYAAVSGELSDVTGAYLQNSAVVPVRDNVFDAQTQKALWEHTCKTLDINFDMV